MEVFGNIILNIFQRHNFFQSFASIGRVDLVIIYWWLFCWFISDKSSMEIPLLLGCSMSDHNPTLRSINSLERIKEVAKSYLQDHIMWQSQWTKWQNCSIYLQNMFRTEWSWSSPGGRGKWRWVSLDSSGLSVVAFEPRDLMDIRTLHTSKYEFTCFISETEESEILPMWWWSRCQSRRSKQSSGTILQGKYRWFVQVCPSYHSW